MRFATFQQIQQQLQRKLGTSLGESVLERFYDERIVQILLELGDSLVAAVDKKQPKALLGFALDLAKPYLQGLGLRIVKLNQENLEIKIPVKTFLKDSVGTGVDEGVLCTAAGFALKTLWKHNSPDKKIPLQVQKIELEMLASSDSELQLKMQFPKTQREAIFAELMNQKKSNLELTALIYNLQEQLVARVQVQAALDVPAALGWD